MKKPIAAVLLAALILCALPSCSGQTEKEKTDVPRSATQDAAASGETAPPTASQTDRQVNAAKRKEALALLTAFDEETEDLSQLEKRFFEICPDRPESAEYRLFESRTDPEEYLLQSELSAVREGMTAEEIFAVVSLPQFTCWTRTDEAFVPRIFGLSAAVDVPLLYEVKTLFLTDRGEILEIVFEQRYSKTKPFVSLEDITPLGFTVRDVNVYTCEEIEAFYSSEAASSENVG